MCASVGILVLDSMEITHHNDNTQDDIAPRLQAWGKAIILFGLAIYFGVNILTGNVSNYINIRFVWLSYVAMVLFAALGTAVLYGILRGDDHTNSVDYGHRINVSWGIMAICAMPLVLGTLIPSAPLGADAVNGDISLSAASFNTATAFQRAPLERNILDWLRVFNQDVPSAFNGQPANVTGFVYREPGFPENTFMVARFTIACCVADASAIGFPVYAPDADSLADGEWVEVRGAFQAGDFRDTTIPILQVDTLNVVEQPEHPYLYP